VARAADAVVRVASLPSASFAVAAELVSLRPRFVVFFAMNELDPFPLRVIDSVVESESGRRSGDSAPGPEDLATLAPEGVSEVGLRVVRARRVAGILRSKRLSNPLAVPVGIELRSHAPRSAGFWPVRLAEGTRFVR
jgi:hypothetical protein